MDNPPDKAQHYIECSYCTNYSEFYCNTCHKRICEQCRDIHQEEKEVNHEIVPYQWRLKELPAEKCQIHPTKDVDLHCSDCQIPVCSKCFTLDHNNHNVLDLETVYEESQKECRKGLSKIRDTILPQTEEKLMFQRKRIEDVKKDIANLRLSMEKRADYLKAAVDNMLYCKNAKVDEIEKAILDEIRDNENALSRFISYLRTLIADYETRMTLSDPINLIAVQREMSSTTMRIPDVSEPFLPQFKPADIKLEEMAKQFGEIKIIKDETSAKTQSSQKDATEPHLKLCSSAKEVKKLKMPDLDTVSHLSASSSSGKFWASNGYGNLMHCDIKGNLLQEKSTEIRKGCCHAVTMDEELLCINEDNETILKLGSDKKFTKIFTVEKGYASSIYSSHINGDILVGIEGARRWRVTRYSKEGKKCKDILRDNRGWSLYTSIFCITENINGDICISDNMAHRVVVVSRSGEYRFTYFGHKSQSTLSLFQTFDPSGICTDVLGHVLVCNAESPYFLQPSDSDESGIHVLDKDGQFLSLIRLHDHSLYFTGAVCVGYKHNLLVGCQGSSTVIVLQYLKNNDT